MEYILLSLFICPVNLSNQTFLTITALNLGSYRLPFCFFLSPPPFWSAGVKGMYHFAWPGSLFSLNFPEQFCSIWAEIELLFWNSYFSYHITLHIILGFLLPNGLLCWSYVLCSDLKCFSSPLCSKTSTVPWIKPSPRSTHLLHDYNAHDFPTIYAVVKSPKECQDVYT